MQAMFFFNVRLLRLKSSARNHRNYLINELDWKSRFSSCSIAYNFSFYYNHSEITGDPCNLIGSQQCVLFTSRTIIALNLIYSKLRHSCSKSHNFCLKLQHFCSYIASFLFRLQNEYKSLFASTFHQTTSRSIIWYWLNSQNFKTAVIRGYLNFV